MKRICALGLLAEASDGAGDQVFGLRGIVDHRHPT